MTRFEYLKTIKCINLYSYQLINKKYSMQLTNHDENVSYLDGTKFEYKNIPRNDSNLRNLVLIYVLVS